MAELAVDNLLAALAGRADAAPGRRDARVAVVDIGTNSTRLLVADVDDGRVTELDRARRSSRGSARASTPAGGSARRRRQRVFAALDELRRGDRRARLRAPRRGA